MSVASKTVIFFVEDSANDRLFFKRAFESIAEEVVVVTAENVKEAFEYLNNVINPGDRQPLPMPDLLLTDLKMPGLSGFELLEWARIQPGLKGMKLAVLTGSNLEVDKHRAKKLGAERFFTKPSGIGEHREIAQQIFSWFRDNTAQPKA